MSSSIFPLRHPPKTLIIVCLAALTLFSSCGLFNYFESFDTEKYYKKSLKLKVDGQWVVGMAAVQSKSSYELEFKSPGKISNISLRTCSDDEVLTPDTSFWQIFKDKKRFEYTYKRTPLDSEKCSGLDIGTYEKGTKARHSFGSIYIAESDEVMPARLECGKSIVKTTGISVCQNAAGLIQRINFDRNVHTLTNKRSECFLKSRDQKSFEVFLAPGECNFYFIDKSSGELHRFVTYGYTEVFQEIHLE